MRPLVRPAVSSSRANGALSTLLSAGMHNLATERARRSHRVGQPDRSMMVALATPPPHTSSADTMRATGSHAGRRISRRRGLTA
jgi:hypothetical protein